MHVHFFSKKLIIDSLNLCDILKLNEQELPIVADYFGFKGDIESQLDLIISHFKLKYVVYTMGKSGSIISSTNVSSYEKVPKIEVVDTVGAGDAFTAIFITGILKGINLLEIHRKATEISAFVCTQKGATPKVKHEFFQKIK